MSASRALGRDQHDDFRRQVEETRRSLTAHFERGDPVTALSVEPNRPLDVQDFAFVGKTPEQKHRESYYRCSFCQTERKFGGGRIVISRSDRRLRLIGDECWETHINRDRFEAEAADYRAYTSRVAFENIKGPLRDEVTRIIGGLVRAMDRQGNAFEFVADLPRMMRAAAPEFQRVIRDAYTRAGHLTVERLVIVDTSFREALRRDDGRPDLKREPKRRWETVSVGQLGGLSALFEVRSPWSDGNAARVAIIDAKRVIEDTAWELLTDRQAGMKLRQVRELLAGAASQLERCRAAFRDASALLSLSSLSALSAWMNDRDCELGYERATEIRVTQSGFRVIGAGSALGHVDSRDSLADGSMIQSCLLEAADGRAGSVDPG
ncbi:hypothetical protein AAFN86_03590 [Roseomonas sp. CAU 1739]|uniref:hypothetical protein n=1 Tax=Roseomonas sp. CAU 1739 TaxID=3140364 RepID=UPI00325A8588